MRRSIILAATCLFSSLVVAAPLLPEQLQLRVAVQPNIDLGLTGNSMFNPRFFDGKIYANQINTPCFGRYPSGDSSPEMVVNNSGNNTLEHRMVAPFRGTNATKYVLGSSSAIASAAYFTRYDFDGNNPVSIDTPDLQLVDAFDWVDENTIIFADYTSGNRKRLYLATVVAEPFAVTKSTAWNANGYITTGVSTRIRNVRKGDVYSGYVYYGDAGVATGNFYALNLATGAETLLGSVTGLTGATTSYGVWTVLERGGYLYVQTSDNGIHVYNMSNATTLGASFATYSKAQLDAITGGSAQYFGLDVTHDGKKMLVGGLAGNVYELEGLSVPYQPEQLQLRTTIQPSFDLGITGNSMFNPRFFDGKVYANQINVPCFGRYASGSIVPEVAVNNSSDTTWEHRMVAPFRGSNRKTYLLGSSSAFTPATTTFARYNYDGSAPVTVDSPDTLTVDAFDWIDDDTVIYAIYTSGQRNKLYLADVVGEPFTVTKSTAWNANGYVTTSAGRIRNVRKGDLYPGYAYYGNAGAATANFYALNLATGAETLLGSVSALTGATTSYGLWTVVERDGYLYVQTTDNGVYVYKLTDATTLGSLHATYTKQQLDALTGGSTQYFGLDVTPNGGKLLLGGLEGKVYELEGRPTLTIARSGADVVLAWPASGNAMVLQSSTAISTSFVDMDPQHSVIVNDGQNTVTLPLGSGSTYFRLRKAQ